MFNKPSMSEIDFWVILIQFKRTEQDLKNLITVSCLSLSKNPVHVKNEYERNRVVVSQL
jgi:hypothetical protein